MEQSTKAVESQTQAPENQQAIAVPPQAPASTFTKVDNNLTGIGFFTASSKRSRKEIEKTTVITDQGIERRISILPSAKYGLPITQDQDYWLALMKLVAEHLQREGKLVNPFSFTTAGLTKILGQAHSGKNYKAVQEWADVMAFTGIKGGAYDAVKKRWLTDRTHAVERFVNIGRELPDGRIAEKNYVWFSQWQLDNINAGNLIAIELTTYIQLENNIAKNLVPHLQEWLFASQRDGRFEKQYEDLCQLLGIRTYHYHSDIHRQLAPSFDELLSHGYLSKWAIDTMANRHSYKLVLWHGSKYHSDRHTRLEQKQRIKTIPSGDATDPSPAAGQSTTPAHRPRPRRPKPSPVAEPSASPAVVIDYRLVAELGKRGVGEIDARQLLASLPPGRPLLDQLEWGDIQIEQSRGKITNPPGFYISLLQRNVPLPSTFESSATRIARQQAEFSQTEAQQKQRQTAQEAEDVARRQADAQLAGLPPEAHQALLDQAKAEIFHEHPFMAKQKDASAIHEGAIRARMRNLLKDGWSFHQATNPVIRQADRLQEPVPRPAEPGSLQPVAGRPQLEPPPAVLNLESLLATSQLSPPSEQAASDRQHYDAFCRQQAQAAIAALDMMERGRRLRAARMFLLNEHPQKDYYHQLVTDEKYEQFHKHSEDRLMAVTIASLDLPNFEVWQASQQGQN